MSKREISKYKGLKIGSCPIKLHIATAFSVRIKKRVYASRMNDDASANFTKIISPTFLSVELMRH